MSAIYLAANQVLGTGFGHLQLVFDPDETLNSGNEVEIEVQPTSLFIDPSWDVSPEQPFAVPFGAETLVSAALDLDGRVAEDVWALLLSARGFFAARDVEYHLGLAVEEGQNSNSYITTLSHIVDLDISGAVSGFLGDDGFVSFPGQARNVLFDLLADEGPGALALEMSGTRSDDIIRGGAGQDRISGSDGHDRIFGAGERDDLDGGAGRDALFGGAGGDLLRGDAGRDRLSGQNGRDVIDGGSGHDRLFGQVGADKLEGGSGNDRLNGGRGKDTFVFNSIDDEGRDTIVDFEIGRDRILLNQTGYTVTGTDTALIRLDGGTEIELLGIAADQVSADFFVFDLIV